MGNIYFAGGSGGGVDPDDCTATPAQLLEGHTAGVNGYDDPVEGTMPYQKQEGTLNCGQSSIILPGYHDGTRSITANSLASQTPGTASAANIYPGQTAWVNGNKITGTMATQGGGTYTAGTADKTVVAANRFVTGNVVVKGDSNLTAGNIKKGVKIMGITGTWEGYVPTATDLYLRGNNIADWSCSSGFVTFNSGEITFNKRGGSTSAFSFSARKAYNLSPYTKLNIQTNNLRFDVSLIIELYDEYSDRLGSIELKENTNYTTTLIIPFNRKATTFLKLRVMRKVSYEYDLTGAIYRIWLS